MQGNCVTVPPAAASEATPMRRVNLQHCVVVGDFNMLAVNTDNAAGVKVWLPRLYLRMQYTGRSAAMLHMAVYGELTSVYVEQVVFQGDTGRYTCTRSGHGADCAEQHCTFAAAWCEPSALSRCLAPVCWCLSTRPSMNITMVQ